LPLLPAEAVSASCESAAPSHTLHHGWVAGGTPRVRIDEVVAAIFRAPRSYTPEDVVELS
jgi:tRNA modification GTPase